MGLHRKRGMLSTRYSPSAGVAHSRVPVRIVRASLISVAGLLTVMSSSGVAGAESANTCLTSENKFDSDCPSIDATAKLAIAGESIRVTIGAEKQWEGGPIAVEMSVPEATVNEPEGVPKKQGKGYANWISRNGTIVSRCEFDPSKRPIKKDGVAECDLQLLGLKDGTHTMWLTGFVGAVPNAADPFGTVPAGQGVAAIATPRSIEFSLAAGAIKLSKPSTVDTDNPPVQVQITEPDVNPVATTAAAKTTEKKTSSDGFPWLPVGGGAAAAVVVGGLIAAKRRSGTPDSE